MASKDGGSAFPFWHSYPEGGGREVDGMSIRDYFAGQALIAVLINQPHAKVDESFEVAHARISDGCYAIADAMLKAREA